MNARTPYADVPSLVVTGSPDQTWSLKDLCPGPGDDVEIEIGFGKGRFLVERAAACPGVRLLGIEWRRKYVHIAQQRLTRRGTTNASVYHGDARNVLSKILESGTVLRIFVNFPDPWWKNRHRQRELMISVSFLAILARLLKPGGEIFIQTDVSERATKYLTMLHASSYFENASSSGDWLSDNPFGARSDREATCIGAGMAIYRLLFRKRIE